MKTVVKHMIEVMYLGVM